MGNAHNRLISVTACIGAPNIEYKMVQKKRILFANITEVVCALVTLDGLFIPPLFSYNRAIGRLLGIMFRAILRVTKENGTDTLGP